MLYVLLVFLLAFGVIAYLHMSNNRYYFEQWKKIVGQDTALRLHQFAWARTVQVLAAIAFGAFAVLLTNYIQPPSAVKTGGDLSVIQAQLIDLGNMQKQLMQTQEAMQKQLSQQQAVAADAPHPPPLARNPQIEISARTVTPEDGAGDGAQEAPNPADAASIMQDVYNPEEVSSDKQSVLDAIKKRYEGLLVNYLFLQKCGLIDPQDYHTIISTLSREMASVNAPGRLENDILVAAQGSYKEMYSGSDCNTPDTEQLHKQYADYIKTISNNIPPAQ